MSDNKNRHDDGKEIVDEMKHDPAAAEQQSVASVAKTDDNVKRAPARKGDKRNSEPMTKAGKMNAVNQAMKEMTKENFDVLYNAVINGELPVAEGAKVEYDYRADLYDLIDEDDSLDESFKVQAGTIFETAVNQKVSTALESLEEQYQADLDGQVESIRTEMVEGIDRYLTNAVEKWLEENRVAIDTGLRNEIAEGFMANLKDIFEQHYIDATSRPTKTLSLLTLLSI